MARFAMAPLAVISQPFLELIEKVPKVEPWWQGPFSSSFQKTL